MTAAPSPEETQLLLRAFSMWKHDDEFTDAEVAQVKAIFQHVFSTQQALLGFVIKDALIMRGEQDPEALYCLVVNGGGADVQFVRVPFTASNFHFSEESRFEEVLMIAAAYHNDPRDIIE